MSIAMALTSIFGKAVTNKLIPRLVNRSKGTEKLEAVAAAVERGKPIVEACKNIFGDDFFKDLNAVMGAGKSNFSYEAGIAEYIKADTDAPRPPLMVLRDELNLNLNRLNFNETTNKKVLKNHFGGLFHVWRQRYQELAPAHHDQDAKATFAAIDKLLGDDQKTFKDLFQLTSVTGLGVGGALLVISSVCLATSTGVGVIATISAFLFGIPWLSVAGLAFPGALMLGLAAMRLRDDQAMSACVQLAYKLIERRMGPETNHQPTTQREQ